MSGIASAGYLRDMHTLFDAGTVSGLSDRQLLQRFTGEQGSSAEAAFDALVLLQAEVERLPDHLRAVVILCYWEGLTHEQAAARLGCPLGTVRSRVGRARGLLHRRLSRRGLEPVLVMLAAFDSPEFLKASAVEIPASLVSSTVQIATKAAAGGSLAQLTSPAIVGLVQKVIGDMSMTKLKTIAVCMLLIGAGPMGDTGGIADRGHAQGQGGTRVWVHVGDVESSAACGAHERIRGRSAGSRTRRAAGRPSRPADFRRAAGATQRDNLSRVVRRCLRRRAYRTGSQGKDCQAPSQIPAGRRTRPDQAGRRDWQSIKDANGEPVPIDPKESDRVFVDVTAYNSKYYYVQGEFETLGKLPITGHEPRSRRN